MRVYVYVYICVLPSGEHRTRFSSIKHVVARSRSDAAPAHAPTHMRYPVWMRRDGRLSLRATLDARRVPRQGRRVKWSPILRGRLFVTGICFVKESCSSVRPTIAWMVGGYAISLNGGNLESLFFAGFGLGWGESVCERKSHQHQECLNMVCVSPT